MGKVLSIFLATEEQKTSFKEQQKALLPLLKWAYSFSPIVALDSMGEAEDLKFSWPMFVGINMDISGCEKLFKGEVNLLRKVACELEHFGFRSRIAIAPTLGSAWGISRYSKNRFSITSEAHLRSSLEKLPVAALRLENSLLDSLYEIDIKQIKHLLSIPPALLLSRFGKTLLKRIDQALGREAEPLIAKHPAQTLYAKKIFTGPVLEFETLQKTLSKLLELLLKKLQIESQKISALFLEIKTVSLPLKQKEISLSIPSKDWRHIWPLLTTQLERLDMGLGVESLALRVPQTENLIPIATAYLPEEKQCFLKAKNFAQLLDLLTSTLDESSVLQIKKRASYIPEKSFSYLPATISEDFKDKAPSLNVERPSVLFHYPVAIRTMALMPDGAPFWLEWRGKKFSILQGIGPERIAPEWWGKDEVLTKTRDYFKLQIESGSWLWVFREKETNKWFIHGLWA